jgi:hypothetical protein
MAGADSDVLDIAEQAITAAGDIVHARTAAALLRVDR